MRNGKERRRARRGRFVGWRRGRTAIVIDLAEVRRIREQAAREAAAAKPERPEPEPPAAAMRRVA